MNPFRPEEARRYFENRLGRPLKSLKGSQMVACPFHDDSTESLSVNLDKAVWKCHACNIGGGLIHFEKQFTDCTDGEAWKNICEITGHEYRGDFKPEAMYVYEDEFGRPLFRVVRSPKDEKGKKHFVQEGWNGRGWSRSLGDSRRVLYHLPEVVTSSEVFICEGEKDADNVRALNLAGDRSDLRITATTYPGGAGKWREEYSPFLTGKRVFLLPDVDPPPPPPEPGKPPKLGFQGQKSAEQIAKSVYKYAAGVKVVYLPNDNPAKKLDVSDYLLTHTKEELINLIRSAPQWKPPADGPTGEDRFFVDAVTFASTVADEVEWAVKPIIPRGANGFIVADPKSLKSFSAVNLVLHLALGKDWLGFSVPRRMRCAMLAREDAWQLTAWRIKHFLRGMDVKPEDVESLRREWLLFNTRMQSPNFALTNDEDLEQLIKNLKKRQTEFLVMDVFRLLFVGDENDNSEMQQVLERVRKIQAEVGCAIGIVHHARKEGEGSIFHRTRGASAIHGFLEWGVGMTTCNPEDDRKDWVRKMEFLTKNGSEPEPIYVKAEDGSDCIRLVRCDPPAKSRRNKPAQLVKNYYDKEESDE